MHCSRHHRLHSKTRKFCRDNVRECLASTDCLTKNIIYFLKQDGNGLVAFPVTFARLHDFGDNFQITVKSEGDRFDFFAKFKYTVKSVLKFSNQDV
ncbi:hypothetical protein CEXT_691551 [Caerostris extrusa]|uniref:Uncharacterized protein n=1 Tax=Caerostris extrusa TaxID=172846 RepID=A0AAV4SHS4_CAEEX|nr:hypothetical protein CEXT_691551 [Caerostris extrusa]